MNDLPPTGELDESTMEVMKQPRCGLEDPFNKKQQKYRLMGESQSTNISGYVFSLLTSKTWINYKYSYQLMFVMLIN